MRDVVHQNAAREAESGPFTKYQLVEVHESQGCRPAELGHAVIADSNAEGSNWAGSAQNKQQGNEGTVASYLIAELQQAIQLQATGCELQQAWELQAAGGEATCTLSQLVSTDQRPHPYQVPPPCRHHPHPPLHLR